MGKTADLQCSYLLGMVHSVFITLDEAELVQELSPTILYGRERSLAVLDEFPIVYQETKEWWEPIIEKVNIAVNTAKETFSPRMIVAFGSMICNDLLDELCNAEKRTMILELSEILDQLDHHLDDGKENFDDYRQIDPILDDVYSVIGFQHEWKYQKWLKKMERRAKRATK